MNWGWGILISIVLFFGLMGYLLFRSSQVDFSLVREDYYQEELKFQDQIKKSENSIKNELDIDVAISNKNVMIDFNNHAPDSGSLWIYSPRDQKFDQNVELNDRGERIQVDMSDRPVGKYILKFDYYTNGVGLYKEKTIFLK